jgi:hypothetical protein
MTPEARELTWCLMRQPRGSGDRDLLRCPRLAIEGLPTAPGDEGPPTMDGACGRGPSTRAAPSLRSRRARVAPGTGATGAIATAPLDTARYGQVGEAAAADNSPDY